MGVHVILEIDSRGIDAQDWAAVYDETRALLEAWQPRLMGWGTRKIEGVRVPMYMRSIRSDEDDPKKAHWTVVGDRESLQTAESQSLYRDLAHYRRSRAHRGEGEADDIVVAAAAPENEYMSGPVRVFGDKTQGHPYHFAVLAAAMLVEERFPRHAMVGGDIDRGQADEARRLASPILGRELPLPVRVDAPRLIARLRARYQGEVLARAFVRAFLDDVSEREEAMLRAFPGQEGAALWLQALARYKTPNALGVTRQFASWLNAGRDVRELCHLACLAPEGPRFSPEGFVDALASTWVAIPRPAREPLDVFRKPTGASHTVASLLASFLLDSEAMGRHLRVHVEPATLAAALGAVFGDHGPALATRLLEKSAKLEAALRERAHDIDTLVEGAGDAANDDTEALATIPSADMLGPTQKTMVRVMAWNAMNGLTTLRGSDPKLAANIADLKEAKDILTKMLSERSPVLTEDAWDAIIAERDLEVVSLWLVLMCMDANELRASQVRRAFFENAEMRRLALRIWHDPREMQEIGEMVAKATQMRAEMAGRRG